MIDKLVDSEHFDNDNVLMLYQSQGDNQSPLFENVEKPQENHPHTSLINESDTDKLHHDLELEFMNDCMDEDNSV